jgi:hypothetical protein
MYDYKKKAKNISQLNDYMLAKTLSMFEYEGLPKTLPHRDLEKMLQVNGYVFITEHEGDLYAFTGGLGGVLDAYGNATEIVVANPYLKLNKTFNIHDDGVLIRNDDMCMGLMPLYNKAHSMIVENDINMTLYGFNSRTQKVISASDDKTKESAETFIKKAVDGELAVIGESAFLEGVKVQPTGNGPTGTLQSLVEYHQYIKAGLMNEVGLSAAFNMKRERVLSGEVEQSEDGLFPLIFNMLQCRYIGFEALKERYNITVKVDFGSVWKRKALELIDDKIPETQPVTTTEEKPDESQLGNPAASTSDSGTGNAEQKAEIEAMLLDETLTDDDRATLMEMLAELE